MSKLREKQREAGVSVLPRYVSGMSYGSAPLEYSVHARMIVYSSLSSNSAGEEEEEELSEGLDDKVVQVYRGVGKLLSRYTVGKIPKAFKIIPNLKNWEEILYLTDPEGWTPQAMFEVIRVIRVIHELVTP